MKNCLVLFASLVLFFGVADAQQGLIARYPLDSNPNDTTGNYGPMTLINTLFQDGGIYCDGIYKYSGDSNWCQAVTPWIKVINLQAFSMQVKFKVSEYGINHVLLCGFPHSGYTYRWLDFFLMGDSTVAMYDSEDYVFIHSTIRYTINTWHEATVAYDSVLKAAKFYLDTTFAGTVQNLRNRPDTISIDITNDGWSNAVFKGVLSDLRIYSTAAIPTGVRISSAALPEGFELYQNYPNPFNPTTVISYQLSGASRVTLKVYDLLGREVATLVNEKQSVGNHSVTFNGGSLPTGVYFYRLQAGSFTETKKLVLLR